MTAVRRSLVDFGEVVMDVLMYAYMFFTSSTVCSVFSLYYQHTVFIEMFVMRKMNNGFLCYVECEYRVTSI